LVDLVFGSYSRRRPLARPIQATADHTIVRVENGDRNLGILGTNLLQDVQSVHPRHIVIATGAVEIIPIEAVEPVSGAGFGDYFDQLLFTVENCGLESNV
jgi:hypothetical protein